MFVSEKLLNLGSEMWESAGLCYGATPSSHAYISAAVGLEEDKMYNQSLCFQRWAALISSAAEKTLHFWGLEEIEVILVTNEWRGWGENITASRRHFHWLSTG